MKKNESMRIRTTSEAQEAFASACKTSGRKQSDVIRELCEAAVAYARDNQGRLPRVIEIFLWLMFLLPGLIYSIWRLSSRQAVCPQCRQPGMVPVTTPIGTQLVEAQGKTVML